jgi:RNA polymerase sigma-70 factor (ECF subfamily)
VLLSAYGLPAQGFAVNPGFAVNDEPLAYRWNMTREPELAAETATGAFEPSGARRKSVESLYLQYSQALRRFLSRGRLSQEEVSDIVQETYCRVHQAGRLDAIRNPKAFLFRVARNIRLNDLKHRRAGVEVEAADPATTDVASEDPGPYRTFQSQQELAVVRAALEELPPRCREAFVLNRFQGMTFTQIATELGLSVSMIEKHVSHAIVHLRRRLQQAQQPIRAREASRLLRRP